MQPKVDFLSTVVGLQVRCKVFAENLPESFTCEWDWGDGSTDILDDIIPITHTYEKTRDYRVYLVVKDRESGEEVAKIGKTIGVSEEVKTQLSASIYDLIDQYIPADIFGEISLKQKQMFIEKWQLYIQPLVNHCIPIEEYNNELFYEALENQLIMELAAWDFMNLQISLMVGASAQTIIDGNAISSSESEETVTSGKAGDVKRIQTGPTEVEFFNQSESDSKNASNIVKAIQPGGILDMLRQQLCMLAERLDIYLPICRDIRKVVTPKVVNHRRPGPLDGPDPGLPVFKGRSAWHGGEK